MADTNPNLVILEIVASALGPIREEVVFVGGCAAGLLLTQTRAEAIRPTEDVDLVIHAILHRITTASNKGFVSRALQTTCAKMLQFVDGSTNNLEST